MSKIDSEMLLYLYGITYYVIKEQVDGLTHQESLLQLPFRGNCLNWVLGHIVVHRDKMLTMLGEERVWTEEQSALYGRDSAPITEDNSDKALPFVEIMAAFEKSHARLIAVLEGATPAELEIIPEGSKSTISKKLAFWYFHESYHTGQTEYLRQLAGKNDKVI